MNTDAKIFVSGHRGMVGSAILRMLEKKGYDNLLTAGREQLDLTRQQPVENFFSEHQPDVVIVAAARVGGIEANRSAPADFLKENILIATHTIDAAHQVGVPRLLFLGSSCIYPKQAPQPIPESALLSSALEPTNEGYALAKIAGLKLCQYIREQHGLLYHSAMPCNLYGPGDYYHAEKSHVIPALLQRFHEAKICEDEEVIIWGSGKPLREFLHVDDLASACLHLLQMDEPPNLVNVGSSVEISVLDLAELIAEVVGYEGSIKTDPTRPDGAPRKLMDGSLMAQAGWSPQFGLREGLEGVYKDFLAQTEKGSLRA